MDDNERKTGIDNALSSYTHNGFQSVDARLMTPDNFESVVFMQSGLAGSIPGMYAPSIQPPSGAIYNIAVNGLGGTPSPISAQSHIPLINSDAQFAESFVRTNSGYNGDLY